MRKGEYLHDRAIVTFKSAQNVQRLRFTPADDLSLAQGRSQRGGIQTLSSVYVVSNAANPLLKIGYADNLKSRISGLQCGSPVELSLVHFVYFVDGMIAKQIEGDVHKILAEWRRKGEWFDVTAEQAGDAIAKAATAKRVLWFSEDERLKLGQFARLTIEEQYKRDRLFGT
jgi:hypothetical protein